MKSQLTQLVLVLINPPIAITALALAIPTLWQVDLYDDTSNDSVAISTAPPPHWFWKCDIPGL
jgi:hypothetical protein